MNWHDVEAEFEWDGSLLDLYVPEADIGTWQRALDILRASPYPLSYTVDNGEVALPAEVKAIFSKRLEANTMLSIDVQGIRINCHFFDEGEIEFDIDPREINNETQFGHLCAFIQLIGQGLGKNVALTPENSGYEAQEVVIRYLTIGDEFEHVPASVRCAAFQMPAKHQWSG